MNVTIFCFSGARKTFKLIYHILTPVEFRLSYFFALVRHIIVVPADLITPRYMAILLTRRTERGQYGRPLRGRKGHAGGSARENKPYKADGGRS